LGTVSYIQPLMNPGEKIQVSPAGGGQVRWPAGGKELFYMSLDGKLMSVSLRPFPDGRGFDIGSAVELFQTNSIRQWSAYHYVVSPDGQRFLINTNVAEATLPITVLLNWKAKP
jgi:eukaryotic-like serine/threonine-protein kinase